MERRTKEMVSQIVELKALVSSSNLPSPMMSDKASHQKEQLEAWLNSLKPPDAKQLNVELDCVAVDPPPPGKKVKTNSIYEMQPWTLKIVQTYNFTSSYKCRVCDHVSWLWKASITRLRLVGLLMMRT